VQDRRRTDFRGRFSSVFIYSIISLYNKVVYLHLCTFGNKIMCIIFKNVVEAVLRACIFALLFCYNCSFIYSSIHPFIHSTIYTSIHLSIHLSIHPPIYSFIHPSVIHHPSIQPICRFAVVEVDLYCTNWETPINGNWFVYTCRLILSYKNDTGGPVVAEFEANTPHLNDVSNVHDDVIDVTFMT
jgi:hypothetical protein